MAIMKWILADFESKVVAEKVKLFILCSPHNPVGRVWREEELAAVLTHLSKTWGLSDCR